MTKSTVVFVCTTCRQPELREDKSLTPCGEEMLSRVQSAALGTDVEIRPVACLMGCEHGCNIAVTGDEKMTYVLGAFSPDQDSAQAIVDYAALHAESASGTVPFRQWPVGVKGHFKARIPSLKPLPAL